MDYKLIVEVFRSAAIEAGAAIMEIYDSDDFGTEAKADDSPVTKADLAADAIIVAALEEALPDIPVVTEERAESHSQAASTFILVDPLDGTKEFIKRRGEFTVNIALVENGVPTRGVVYAPAKERLFYTDADGQSVEEAGPFASHQSNEKSPMAVREPDNAALMVVASKSHRDAATDAYINEYAVADMTSAGSSLKFCLVAAGEADIYPRLGRTMEWDTAAGDAVLRGAGGFMVRYDNHATFEYGKAECENMFFIAYAPGVELKAAL